MSTLDLNCKLLCASEAAYCILPKSKPGKYNPCDSHTSENIKNQYNAVGFTEDPYVCVNGEIEAALVGKTDYGIVVAFRGTLPPAWNVPAILDWIENIFLATPTGNIYLPGKVHSGFLLAVQLLEHQVINAIHCLDPYHKLPLYLTGHSKGGGMVPIAAHYFENKYNIHATRTIRFAGPKPGNQDFADAFEAKFRYDVNFQNYLDIVPLLAPSDDFIKLLLLIPGLSNRLRELLIAASHWDYVNVGADAYINSDGHLAAPPSIEDRIGEIFLKLMELDGAAIADAHHISCGPNATGRYRYMQGVCQGHVCKF
ncbi:lipase family protein [Psychroserpens sp. SPM9]|uniref:lipase family protein n=1 Tax=Psychroserpens sp. SPM9 TaxID=2975598 RepID=UPI0021A701E1|nr:lipase family protein [Psychroserpens sp. SPM9]MDG5491593.1 lipase family protein [Psychroserpens sp. SPM9]